LDTDPKFTKKLDPEQLVPDPQKETGRDMTKEYVGDIEAKADLGVVNATSSWTQRHSCAFLWAQICLLVVWGW
jgi:hypothetical protein